jgi:hypothetical protein
MERYRTDDHDSAKRDIKDQASASFPPAIRVFSPVHA